MTEARTYDLIVVGAGSTGENIADYAHRGGLSVVVVEAELVGGECSYWACMPSKALLRSAQALEAARAVGGAAQAVTGELDVAAVLDRRSAFTSHWDDAGQVRWLASAGLELVRGEGRLTGEREVTVRLAAGGEQVLTARHAVALATGSVPFLPPIDGLAQTRVWTAREATSAKVPPARLAILGGGVVGVEMATAYAAFGTEVHLVEAVDRVLANYEPFVSEQVAASLRERGVQLHLGAQAVGVGRPDGGPVAVRLANGDTVEADELLVAVGRRARTPAGLEALGLEPGRYLDVDDTMAVRGLDWLYAAGDVNGRALLTHMGKYQARACGRAIAARARGEQVAATGWALTTAAADHQAVPQVVFSTPEVAAVGLTERQAQEAGLPVRAVEYEIGNVAGAAVYADGYRGHAKMVVDSDRRVIVGLTMTGPMVGELLHAATVAVVGQVPIDRLWHAVPSYPTISEVWLRLLEAYDG